MSKNAVCAELKSYIHVNHPPKNRVTPQSHSCYEMVFYAQGEGKTTIGEELYDFRSGDMAIIEPETVHDELCTTACEVYCCLFTYDGVLPLHNGLYSLGKLDHAETIIQNIMDIFMKIQNEMASKCLAYETAMNFWMGQLIIEFCRTRVNVRIASDSMKYVKTYIKENFTREVNFRILASHVGYSYDRMRHLFRERTGISLSQYLLNVRIRHAKEMLINTNDQIKKIAKATGFGSDARFVEVFREQTGQTPGKFRISSRENVVEKINFE